MSINIKILTVTFGPRNPRQTRDSMYLSVTLGPRNPRQTRGSMYLSVTFGPRNPRQTRGGMYLSVTFGPRNPRQTRGGMYLSVTVLMWRCAWSASALVTGGCAWHYGGRFAICHHGNVRRSSFLYTRMVFYGRLFFYRDHMRQGRPSVQDV